MIKCSLKLGSLGLSLLVLLIFWTQPSLAALSPEQEAIYGNHPFYSSSVETSECSSSATLVGTEAAQQIYNFFTGKGLSPAQAAGLMGNMKAESGLNPKRVQGTKTPDGDKDNITVNDTTGYGLVQWTSKGRQQGLADKATAANVNSGDLAIQLEYVMDELQSGYKGSTYAPLLASSSVEEATNVVLENYERPKDVSGERNKRQNFAREFFTLYGSGTGATTLPTTGSTGGCAVAIDSTGCPTDTIDQSLTVLAEGIRVHPCIAAEVTRLVQLAKARGLNLSGGGWRDNKTQIDLRTKRGCSGSRVYDSKCKTQPPVAVPGRSNHERGTAVDFTCNGNSIDSHSNPCFIFLRDNTSLKNLQSEPWHWSINGG